HRGIPVLGDKGASVHVREFTSAATELGHDVLLACATLGDGNPPPAARIACFDYLVSDEQLNAACARLGFPPSLLSDATMRREMSRLAYDDTFCARVTEHLSKVGFQ